MFLFINDFMRINTHVNKKCLQLVLKPSKIMSKQKAEQSLALLLFWYFILFGNNHFCHFQKLIWINLNVEPATEENFFDIIFNC